MDQKNAYKTFRVASIREDNYRVKTFTLDGGLDCKPGQFVMLWMPRLNERPFSIMDNNPLRFNIANVGETSAKIHSLKVGDKISLRGPYGNGFSLKGGEKKVVLVGGGYGVAPLYFFAKHCLARGVTPVMVIGGRTAQDILLEKDFFELGVKTIVTTDDGSLGMKGFATDGAKHAIAEGGVDAVYSCGPEKMMAVLAVACRDAGIHCQLSTERYMGCGVGICGKCVCDGVRLCRDGPVLTGEEALALKDFGKAKRDPSGKRVTQ